MLVAVQQSVYFERKQYMVVRCEERFHRIHRYKSGNCIIQVRRYHHPIVAGKLTSSNWQEKKMSKNERKINDN